MSKEREEELVEKMAEYEKRKWNNRNNKLKIKERLIEEEISGYFKPQVCKSSEKLALRSRSKNTGVAMVGQSLNRSENETEQAEDLNNANESIFDRLYQESKDRQK